MDRERFFSSLWGDFVAMAPRAAEIRARFEAEGERVVNDHVAFRTFDLEPIDLASLERPILALGYRLLDEYRFEAKHLRARAYVCPGHPRIFLSELLTAELSDGARAEIEGMVEQAPREIVEGPEVFWSGRAWRPPAFEGYERLSAESEYAGWLAALGLRPNHFTVSINELTRFPDVESVLRFVESMGHAVNASGGRVKGTRDDLLEQGSTLADRMPVEFSDGRRDIPTCYYEFALRHRDREGRLYDGFVPASADRIFESTDRRARQEGDS